MAKKIDATKREDVLLLAKCLETTPVAEWWKVLGFGPTTWGLDDGSASGPSARRPRVSSGRFRGTVGVLAFFKHRPGPARPTRWASSWGRRSATC